jgi:hypothetical protein
MPRVAQERVVGRDRALANSRFPVCGGGQVDLADDELDDAVHEVALVGHVVVQRHRFDAELTGELAHRERFDPALIGEADGGVQHTLPAEGDAGL